MRKSHVYFLFFAFISCTDFGQLTLVADLSKSLKEVSGNEMLSNSDLIWMINDSGNKPEVFGLNQQGGIEKIIKECKEKINFKLINDSEAMQVFPFLVKSVKEYISFKPNDIIELYGSSITYSPEYFGLKEFKTIYPDVYDKCLNIKSIRRNIKEQILYDLEGLDPEDYYTADEIDNFFEYIVDELFEEFGMRMTKKFKNQMELMAFDGLPRNEYSNWGTYDKKQTKEEKKRRKQELKKREKEEKEIKNLFNQVIKEKEINGLIDIKKKKNDCHYPK